MKKLVLGSGSPRRQEILESLGAWFDVRPAEVDEAVADGEAWDVYLARIVSAKLDKVLSEGASDEIVLVADTIVVCDDRILGKPKGAKGAEAMLRSLSGRQHVVVTRFALGERQSAAGPTHVLHEQSVSTNVWFRPLDEATINAYVGTGECADKAGAYAIQGRAAGFALRIDGSYANVVGLPACEVMMALETVGLLP